MAGVRLVEPSQMHLTLHFIGEADIERMRAALQAVAAPAFLLTIEGVGQLSSAGKTVTLWARVRDNAELLGLHAAIVVALAGVELRPEIRRYTPHITLARCAPRVPTAMVAEFLDRHAAFSLPGVPIAEFSLYSSTLVGGTSVYRRERSFPLLVVGSAGSV